MYISSAFKKINSFVFIFFLVFVYCTLLDFYDAFDTILGIFFSGFKVDFSYYLFFLKTANQQKKNYKLYHYKCQLVYYFNSPFINPGQKQSQPVSEFRPPIQQSINFRPTKWPDSPTSRSTNISEPKKNAQKIVHLPDTTTPTSTASYLKAALFMYRNGFLASGSVILKLSPLITASNGVQKGAFTVILPSVPETRASFGSAV